MIFFHLKPFEVLKFDITAWSAVTERTTSLSVCILGRQWRHIITVHVHKKVVKNSGEGLRTSGDELCAVVWTISSSLTSRRLLNRKVRSHLTGLSLSSALLNILTSKRAVWWKLDEQPIAQSIICFRSPQSSQRGSHAAESLTPAVSVTVSAVLYVVYAALRRCRRRV